MNSLHERTRSEIKHKTKKIKNREKNITIIRMGLFIMLFFLVITYLLLSLAYSNGGFTISLDDDLSRKAGIAMYEKLSEKDDKKVLSAGDFKVIDNISINWLPSNLNKQGEGSHNGENYLAYSFYIENKGVEEISYWYSVIIDDVIKNIDSAIRVMLYRNDERTVYAKMNERSGLVEPGTEAFYSGEAVATKQRTSFKAGEIDKFTIVIWIEGDDPDCVDALIGGEMKMHMDITTQVSAN